MLAASVASLAFSSCDVKIGILIATKPPMIATTTRSSAIMNYIASKTGPSSYNLTCLLNGNHYNQRIHHSEILLRQSPFRNNLYHLPAKQILSRKAYKPGNMFAMS